MTNTNAHVDIMCLTILSYLMIRTPTQKMKKIYASVTGSPSWSSSICYLVSFFLFSLPALACLVLFSLPFLHIFFQLYHCLYLVEVLSGLLTTSGPIVITHSV
jgi:hypothetical protein